MVQVFDTNSTKKIIGNNHIVVNMIYENDHLHSLWFKLIIMNLNVYLVNVISFRILNKVKSYTLLDTRNNHRMSLFYFNWIIYTKYIYIIFFFWWKIYI